MVRIQRGSKKTFPQNRERLFFIQSCAGFERFSPPTKGLKNRKNQPGRKGDRTIAQISEQFGVSRQCVSNWAKKNGIPQDGNGYIFGKKEIELFQNRNRSGRPRKTPSEPKQTEGQLRNEERVLIEGKKSRGRPRKER